MQDQWSSFVIIVPMSSRAGTRGAREWSKQVFDEVVLVITTLSCMTSVQPVIFKVVSGGLTGTTAVI